MPSARTPHATSRWPPSGPSRSPVAAGGRSLALHRWRWLYPGVGTIRTASKLLYRAPGIGQVPPAELRRRDKAFLAGQWLDLLREAASAAQQKPRTQGRSTTPQGDEEEEDLRRRAE